MSTATIRGKAISGNFLVDAGSALDTKTAAALNVGTNNATSIEMGAAAVPVNVLGFLNVGTGGSAAAIGDASFSDGTRSATFDASAGTFVVDDGASTSTITAGGLTGSGALNVTATGAVDLTFGARSSTTTFNQAGDTALAGFTATSLIGALNEIASGGAAETLAQTLVAGNTSGGTDLAVSTGDRIVGVAELTIVAGTGANAVTITSGTGSASEGGFVFLAAGDGDGSANKGGDVFLVSGDGVLNADGGLLLVRAGNSNGTGIAGNVELEAFSGGSVRINQPFGPTFWAFDGTTGHFSPGTANARDIGTSSVAIRTLYVGTSIVGTVSPLSITGSIGSGAGVGVRIDMISGQGGPTGPGAGLTLRSGAGGVTSGNSGTTTVSTGTTTDGVSGSITISTGNAFGGTNDSGLISIDTGTSGGGTTGTITIAGTNASAVTLGRTALGIVSINSAVSVTAGTASLLTLSGGPGSASASGGVDVVTTTGVGTDRASGGILLFTGPSTGSAFSGLVQIGSDQGGTTGESGGVSLFTGDGGSASGMSGQIVLSTGGSLGGSDTGTIRLETGWVNGATGTSGAISLLTGKGNAGTADSGDINLDTGTSAGGTTGAINLALANASALTLGRGGLAVAVPGSVVVASNMTVTGFQLTTIGTLEVRAGQNLNLIADFGGSSFTWAINDSDGSLRPLAGQNLGLSGDRVGSGFFNTSVVVGTVTITTNTITGAAEATTFTVQGTDATTIATAGVALSLQGGDGLTSGDGGAVSVSGGTSPSGTAGTVTINTAGAARLTVQADGRVDVAQFMRIGTTTDAVALGDLSMSDGTVERFFYDASTGFLRAGDTLGAPVNVATQKWIFSHVAGENSMGIFAYGASTSSPSVTFAKGRGSPASPTSYLDDDTIGAVSFLGFITGVSGDGQSVLASIRCLADGVPSLVGPDSPGRLVFQTTPAGGGGAPITNLTIFEDGLVTVTEHMRIGSSTTATALGDLSAGDGTRTFSWDASLGTFTVGSGGNSTISCPGAGTGSEQFGLGASATGNNSLAVGNGATANTTTTEDDLTAIGASAVASGDGSTAVGFSANATTATSVAIGRNSLASVSLGNIAIGAFATASAGSGGCISIGRLASAGNDSVVVGNGVTATGIEHVAVGFATLVGTGSVAIGAGAKAPENCVAIGANAVATGFTGSVVIGRATFATANSQFVVGSTTIATTTFILGTGVERGDGGAGGLVTYTVTSATDGGAADTSGTSMIFATGKGTGSSASSTFRVQTPTPISTGTVQQTLATRLTINDSISIFTTFVSAPDSGTSSERFGAGATATGGNSLAVGNGATADTTTTEDQMTAIGQGAVASGDASVAIGQVSTSAGGSATAVGQNSSAAGTFSTAIGAGSIASSTSATALGVNTNAAHASTVIGKDAASTASNQLVIGSENTKINQVYIGEGVTSTTPEALTLQVTGGSGTDIAAGSFTIAGGRSTGNAVAGTLLFQVGTPGSSGTTLQTLSTRILVSHTAITIGSAGNEAVTVASVGGTLGFYDTTPVTQPTDLVALTDNSGGSADDTIASITNAANAGSADVGPTADAIADLAAKYNGLRDRLRTLGLMA